MRKRVFASFTILYWVLGFISTIAILPIPLDDFINVNASSAEV